ncbi:hypothetical protein FHW67_001400 [Herbaspirillum sp. Sphag1AN]|uniref:hypothetical protein n=1 Tax=unclassified Herbaspirillum TaxID=2624150 RepID=UPI00161966DA|nr:MULTISPECIES: hypothetical protein [unclassified Herbaspirillum]MBB3212132.1 hypothetical protein [Herbaspirillum sp. Sphag1AN]MBB3244034.1 hypothetical protein [Herbaspirillum sp. Sphag64]
MPMHHVSMRNNIGRHQYKNDRSDLPHHQQERLDMLAELQSKNVAQKCHPLAMMYLAALMLPYVQMVSNSPRRFEHRYDERRGASHHACSRPDDTAWSRAVAPRECLEMLPREMSKRLIAARTLPAPCTSFKNSWLSLACATAMPLPTDGVAWDNDNESVTLSTDESKNLVISLLKLALVKNGEINPEQAERLEFEWRLRTATEPIKLSITEEEDSRSKRISFANHEKNVAAHIGEHCSFEEEIILDLEGKDKGKILLFHAQVAENPFRLLYDSGTSEPSANQRRLATGLQFFTGVVSMGFSTLIGNVLASYLRLKHHRENNDKICSSRQSRLVIAHLGSSLDMSGKLFTSSLSNAPARSAQAASKPSFFSYNKQTQIQRELIVTASSPLSGKPAQKVTLNPQGDNTFVVVSPSGTPTDGAPEHVIFDAEKKIWRYADDKHAKPLELSIEEGNAFIRVNGQTVELDIQQGKLVARQDEGGKFMEVYQSPLSRTWHMAPAVDSLLLKRLHHLLQQLQVMPDRLNQYREIMNHNSAAYGMGTLYEARLLHSDPSKTQPLYLLVEILGYLLPVRRKMIPGQGIRYDLFDLKLPRKRKPTIVWNGKSWTVERISSTKISEKLKSSITADMFDDTARSSRLSAADQQGIRWTHDHRGYLKVKGKFVEVHRGEETLLGRPNGIQIVVRYQDAQFDLAPPKKLSLPRVLSEQGKQAGRQVAQERHVIERLTKSDFQQPIKQGIYITDAGAKILSDTDAGLIYQDHLATDELVITASDVVTLTDIYAFVESASKSKINSDKLRVEQIASASLQTRRFKISYDGTELVLDAGINPRSMRLLDATASARALTKYENSRSSNNIPNIMTLRRGMDIRSPDHDRYIAISRRIQEGASSIDSLLADRQEKGAQGKALVLGESDFIAHCSLDTFVYCPFELIYQGLKDHFIPLSKKYPDAIIAPGSLYISSHIPDRVRDNCKIYRLGDTTKSINTAISFSTKIAPVFSGGKLITIGRKGDYMSRSVSAENTVMTDLGLSIASDTVLSAADTGRIHPESIFTGKTRLPDETKALKTLFANDLTDKAVRNIHSLHNNEFMVDGVKFLLVIGNETAIHPAPNQMSHLRRIALSSMHAPTSVTHGNRYDYLLHISASHWLDDIMLSTSANYVRADASEESVFISETSERTCHITDWPEQHMLVYDFLPT